MKMDLSGLDQFKASNLVTNTAEPAAVTPGQMDLDLIDFDEEQPRQGLCEQALRELAESIKDHGVLEPVSLRPHPSLPGRFIVNRGERRCRASRLAGKRSVPYFIDTRLDRFAQAVENLHREDLSPFSLATFIVQREREGFTRAEIARRLHKPASFITEAAVLLAAPAEVRAVFDAGRARDTRVLYLLTRALRENPGAVAPLLVGTTPLTREVVEAALDSPSAPGGFASLAELSGSGGAPGTPVPAEGGPAPGRSIASPKRPPKRSGHDLLVEHEGRRGRLGWKQPDRHTGEVWFEDGARQLVRLSELRILEWMAG